MANLSTRIPPRLRAYSHVARARCMPFQPDPPNPSATHLLITWRCNLKCSGCDAWQRKVEEELTADEWSRVFAQLHFLDIVKLIGGEPFARDDLGDIIQAIRREINPFVVQLVTNATMPDRIIPFAEQLAWPNLHMRISLDGLGENHDRSRGMQGTFDKVMQTMKGLADLRRHKRFHLAVNFTVTDESLPDMDPLIEQCHALGVDVVPGFKVKPFLKHCDMMRAEVTTIGLANRQEAVRRMQAAPDHGARSGFNSIEQHALKAVNRIVFGKQASGGNALKFRCREVRNLMYMDPHGNLITCGLNQEPIGNILREGFDTVWHSPQAAAARAKVEQCPGCMQGAVEVMSKLYAS